MLKHILTVCLFILFTGQIYGQSTTSQQLFFEKVHLRTDRKVYLAGENLWFSASLVNAQDNRSIATSNTLYVELLPLDKTYEVKRQIVKLENGKGYGDFELEETMAPGLYILRAWTNWMRNFDNNFIFEKGIKIVAKPLKEAEEKNKEISTANKKIKPIVDTRNPKTSIQFSPEGGSLVEEVTSIVAFQTPNHLAIKGTITDSKGELITVLENEKGVGTFIFKPAAGETYTATGHFGNGETFHQKLPLALAKGYGIYVIEKDSTYHVIISTNAASGATGKDVLLVGKSHGLNCFKTQFTIQGMQQAVSVYKSNFQEGIASLTLYDDEGRPNCERLVYVDYKSKPILSVRSEKPSYLANEKVTVNLKLSDADNKPLQGTFSVAALDDAFARLDQSDIVSYLMLESELKGKIENPKQYFDLRNTNRKKQLDLLMLTQGWRDFLWKRIADTTLNISQIPESGITISGSVKQKIGDRPIASSNVTIRSKGENQSQLLSGVTNNKGTFFIDGFKFTGEQKFAVTSINKKTENEGWIKLDPLFKPTPFKEDSNRLNDTVSGNIYKHITNSYKQVFQKKISLENTILLDEVKVKTKFRPVIIGSAVLNDMGYANEEFKILPRDSSYQNLSQYLLANSAQATQDPGEQPEPGVEQRNPGENNHVVFHAGKNIVYPNFIINNKDMFFMEDEAQQTTVEDDTEDENTGVENTDTQIRDNIYNTYLNLPMSEIENVTIKHMVGIRPGPIIVDYFLVYLTLKYGALLGAKGNPIYVKTSGYYQAREFNTDTIADKKADEIFTMYWNPLIETDKNGEGSFSFPSPLRKTKVRLLIEGLESKGNPLVSEQTIEIK